jgi:hypothetical protein
LEYNWRVGWVFEMSRLGRITKQKVKLHPRGRETMKVTFHRLATFTGVSWGLVMLMADGMRGGFFCLSFFS